ncbi:MAG: zf-HC2 domain-containing protein, partial [Chloroflexi bacterium]|nr:zf-HC2 domain-containing protein [Chloroflexota bacterium]
MIDHIPTDDLSALIDDALQPARRSQVEAHLVGCASCRDELATLRWAVDFARALPLAPLPDDFELRLPEATAARAARELALDSRPVRPWAGLLALAAVLTLGLLLSYLARLSQTPLQSGDAAADAEASEAVRSQMAEAPAGSIGPAAAAPGRGLDIDRAAGIAEERMASEDAPETLLQPLATALTGDRTLTGELGQRSSDRSTGPEAAATASVVAADSGGYRPPDAQIPGAAAARDDSAPVAATASALTAVRATAVAALEVLNAAGSGEPPPEAG